MVESGPYKDRLNFGLGTYYLGVEQAGPPLDPRGGPGFPFRRGTWRGRKKASNARRGEKRLHNGRPDRSARRV
jgi:hypothetical protein